MRDSVSLEAQKKKRIIAFLIIISFFAVDVIIVAACLWPDSAAATTASGFETGFIHGRAYGVNKARLREPKLELPVVEAEGAAHRRDVRPELQSGYAQGWAAGYSAGFEDLSKR